MISLNQYCLRRAECVINNFCKKEQAHYDYSCYTQHLLEMFTKNSQLENEKRAVFSSKTSKKQPKTVGSVVHVP